MTDAFLTLSRPRRVLKPSGPAHSERAHSKFSASGSERWFKCPGSVELSEGIPDKPTIWSAEGTTAHELLELTLLLKLVGFDTELRSEYWQKYRMAPPEMRRVVDHTAEFILETWQKQEASDLLVESKVYLDFIHPEAFGTFDAAVVQYFGRLDVFDFKYGQGHSVSVRENLQMLFYGIGLAHLFDWNFHTVRLWIIQPRIRGYDGPVFWDVPVEKLREYVGQFRNAVQEVLDKPTKFVEGRHCHWCKAKKICPLKREAKLNEAKLIFGTV